MRQRDRKTEGEKFAPHFSTRIALHTVFLWAQLSELYSVHADWALILHYPFVPRQLVKVTLLEVK